MLAVFLDQETTGLDASKHSVIEVAFKIVNLTEDRRLADYHWILRCYNLNLSLRILDRICIFSIKSKASQTRNGYYTCIL